jgi:uncharacterized protein (TIGR02996 family)
VDTEHTLLAAIHADPADDTARLALADWLEEEGRRGQAELLRLHVLLRGNQDGPPPEAEFARLCELLASGVRPLVPWRRNEAGIVFALVPPGRFWMGSPAAEPSRFDDEGPEHLVEIMRPFYLGAFPITQEEYESVMGDNPSYFSPWGEGADRVEGLDTSRHPADSLSWDMAEALCGRLTDRTGRRHRLPTEAEWEYACRAGISFAGPFHWGQALSSHLANFDGREPFGGALEGPYLRRTVPVDAYPPNAFGVYDLHGNVSEWCADWFAEDYYRRAPTTDPPGPPGGEHRVLRGGSWTDPGKYCRAAFRYDRPAEEDRRDFGVRVVLEYEG